MPFKSQSAMEYLMTYGWAILIIAIAMIALSQLGAFGGANLTPHATAGACQVVKSGQGGGLAGQCSNNQPQFVAQFNGQSYILTNYNPSGSQVTVSAWVYEFPPSPSASTYPQISATSFTVNGYLLGPVTGIAPYGIAFYAGGSGRYTQAATNFVTDSWQFVTGTYDGNNIRVYDDGVLQATTSNPGVIFGGSSVSIGYGSPGGDQNWNGFISNVQVYNTSLSQSEVTALYQEGIGGAPIDPTHVVGWWPLNGNAQDYSGNNNQGTATAVSYNGSWTSGYTQP